MATQTKTSKTTEKTNGSMLQTNGSTASKNGSQTPSEHLAKANKAMERAWTLISRRQNKSD